MSLKSYLRQAIHLHVVVAIVVGRQEIVLVQRQREPSANRLVLPGGYFKQLDPKIAAAAIREVWEETGLRLKARNLKFLTHLDDSKSNPRPGRHITIVFAAQLDQINRAKLLTHQDPDQGVKSIHLRNLDTLSPREIGFGHWQAIKLLRREG